MTGQPIHGNGGHLPSAVVTVTNNTGKPIVIAEAPHKVLCRNCSHKMGAHAGGFGCLVMVGARPSDLRPCGCTA